MDVLGRIRRAVGRPLQDGQQAGQASTRTFNEGDGARQAANVNDAGTGGKSATRIDPKKADHAAQRAFRDNWKAIATTLSSPDQAALHHGISRTDLRERLQNLCDALVFESNRANDDSDVTGPSMEMLLEGDVLGHLVRLTANDRLAGSQAQVVRLFADLIILLDERFLSRQAVHRPLVRLLRICVGDDSSSDPNSSISAAKGLEDASDSDVDEEKQAWRRFGRGGSAEILGFEEDFVNLLCHVASRLRNTPELLIIFFRQKGNSDEAKRAFNRVMTGQQASSHASLTNSRSSTQPSSPTAQPIGLKNTVPAVSSPLRPQDTPPLSSSPRPPTSSSVAASAGDQASQQEELPFDFPLFSYLTRFVHRESRTGELARAGILFLVDVAFSPGRRNLVRAPKGANRADTTSEGQRTPPPNSKTLRGKRSSSQLSSPSGGRVQVDLGLGPSIALARFILDSDFSEVLGASVGAVYGLLPTKLNLETKQTSNNGMILGEGRKVEQGKDAIGREIEGSSSADVRTQARLLCDLIEFTQDILRTASRIVPGGTFETTAMSSQAQSNVSMELASAGRDLTANICSCLQSLFLESILYPSMLECSDMDGSSVAVMTFLDAVLSVLEDDGALADCFVGWLVATEVQKPVASQPLSTPASDQRHKKHKSTAMLQLERERASQISSRQNISYYSDVLGRYTIRDLIVDNIHHGVKTMASIAALRLATTLLTFHGRFVTSGVLKVDAVETATAFPSLLSHGHSRQDTTLLDNDYDNDDFIYPGGIRDNTRYERIQQRTARRIVRGSSAWQHTTEMELYLSLVSAIEQCALPDSDDRDAAEVSRSTGLGNYIQDAEIAIFQDSTFRLALRAEMSGDGADQDEAYFVPVDRVRTASYSSREGHASINKCFHHRLNPSDRLMRTTIDSLCCFWQNSPEVNVGLMGFLASVAACPIRNLAGLLTFAQVEKQSFVELQASKLGDDTIESCGQDKGDEDDDRSDDEREHAVQLEQGSKFERRRSRPSHSVQTITTPPTNPPIILSIMRALLDQLLAQRAKVANFDRYLAERRRGLLFVENLSEALKASSLEKESSESSGAATPFAAYATTPDEASRLWQSSNVSTQFDQATLNEKAMSPRNVSLPEPPSATPSQGIPQSPDRAMHALEESSEHRPNDDEAGADSHKPEVESSTFARLFGRARHTRTPSAAKAAKKAREAQTKEKELPPPPKPFAQHYLETSSIAVNVDRVHLLRSCPWSTQYDSSLSASLQSGEHLPPGAKDSKSMKRTRFLDNATSPISTSSADDDEESSQKHDYFVYPGQDDVESGQSLQSSRSTTQASPMLLSTLLDNAVVLEESIKELVAILHVRSALGIDPISFM